MLFYLYILIKNNYVDIRKKFPQCLSLWEIGDISNCRSEWASSTASLMGDYLCLYYKKPNFLASSFYLLSCCKNCNENNFVNINTCAPV